MSDRSQRVAWVRAYRYTVWMLAVFMPLYAAGGLKLFAQVAVVRRPGIFLGGLSVGCALALFLGYAAYQGYRRTRSRFLFFTAMGYAGFAVTCTPYFVAGGALSPATFRLLCPLAELVLIVSLLAGLRYLGADSLEPTEGRARGWLPYVTVVAALTGVFVLALAGVQSTPVEVRDLSLVGSALGTLAIGRLLMARVRTMLIQYQTLALLLLVQGGLVEAMAEPWDTFWWFGHAVTLVALVALGYAVSKAYEGGRAFSGIYDETVYYRQQAERLRKLSLSLQEEIVTRRRAEEDLKRSRAETERLYREAQEAGRIKDEFLATLSHELRTPVNVIHGFAEILKDELPKEGRAREAAEAIYRNARIQAELTSDLLDMSRIITGQLALHPEPVELPALVNQVIAGQTLAAEGKRLEIRTIYDPSVGTVNADPVRLAQVVWNLIGNAVKFTPAGGHVVVEVRRRRQDAEIVVRDDGPGIEPSFLPYVFDRFRQQDSSRTRRHGGLGLGLSIVRQLVELHGGTVSVYSDGIGKGAQFTVALPMMAVRLPTAPAPAAAQPGVRQAEVREAVRGARMPLGGFDILVVDDSSDVRLLVGTVLKSQGARVREAASASEAMAMLTSDPPDVLLSDISMPEEDGYELIRKVRELERSTHEHIPAAALTAFARDEERDRALAAGFEMHMAKPVEAASLIRAVSELAHRSRAAETSAP